MAGRTRVLFETNTLGPSSVLEFVAPLGDGTVGKTDGLQSMGIEDA